MNKFCGYFLAFLLMIEVARPIPSHTQSPKTQVEKFGNVAGITAAQLKDYLSFVASDEMAGRDTPSLGLRLTARFLAAQLSRCGLQPAGENATFFQNIALQHMRINPESTVAQIGNQRFKYGEDFLAQNTPGTISAALVYVNQCWTLQSKNIFPDDSIQVKDKIIVTHGGYPPGVGFFELYGKLAGIDYKTPADYAQRRGVKGIIFVPSFHSLSTWPQTRRHAISNGETTVKKFQPSANVALPTITASLHMLSGIFRGEVESAAAIFRRGIAEDEEPIPSFALNPDRKMNITVSVNTNSENTQNVVALWEGNDRKLKHEYVALGAHYDHVGIGASVGGDSIYNGADDDGSGTVALLAMAEALTQSPRPKRSLLFVWHTGEEQGLWGSKYFVEHPLLPLERIVAQLNLDMIGRSRRSGDTNPANDQLSGPDEVYVIGAKTMSTALGELVERVNRAFLQLTLNYKYDDPNDPNRFFFRSDHYHYARKGIPIVFYFNGVHEDYHRPSDHVEKIDFQKMEKVTRTIFATAWELANARKRPAVDKKLPPHLQRDETITFNGYQ